MWELNNSLTSHASPTSDKCVMFEVLYGSTAGEKMVVGVFCKIFAHNWSYYETE